MLPTRRAFSGQNSTKPLKLKLLMRLNMNGISYFTSFSYYVHEILTPLLRAKLIEDLVYFDWNLGATGRASAGDIPSAWLA